MEWDLFFQLIWEKIFSPSEGTELSFFVELYAFGILESVPKRELFSVLSPK